jgi:hypothetical protein
MILLWEDESVRALLRKKSVFGAHGRIVRGWVRTEIPFSHHLTASFLISIDEDVLRARLRTVGIQEYKVHVGNGSSHNSTYDFATDLY